MYIGDALLGQIAPIELVGRWLALPAVRESGGECEVKPHRSAMLRQLLRMPRIRRVVRPFGAAVATAAATSNRQTQSARDDQEIHHL